MIVLLLTKMQNSSSASLFASRQPLGFLKNSKRRPRRWKSISPQVSGSFSHKYENKLSLDVILSEGFLAREVGTPSDASGLGPLEEGSSAVWLVKPRRTKTVLKFSGTLNHPNRQDKVGTTISSFAHFSYQVSNRELVFADIQGTNLRQVSVLYYVYLPLEIFPCRVPDEHPRTWYDYSLWHNVSLAYLVR